MKNVHAAQVAASEYASWEGLPERVWEALGELAGAAKEGLLTFAVGVGLSVLSELPRGGAKEVSEVVGVKGSTAPERAAVSHGQELVKVTLGGRRLSAEPQLQVGRRPERCLT